MAWIHWHLHSFWLGLMSIGQLNKFWWIFVPKVCMSAWNQYSHLLQIEPLIWGLFYIKSFGNAMCTFWKRLLFFSTICPLSLIRHIWLRRVFRRIINQDSPKNFDSAIYQLVHRNVEGVRDSRPPDSVCKNCLQNLVTKVWFSMTNWNDFRTKPYPDHTLEVWYTHVGGDGIGTLSDPSLAGCRTPPS